MAGTDTASNAAPNSNKRPRPPNEAPATPTTQADPGGFPAAYADYLKRIEQATARLQQRHAEESTRYGSTIAQAQRDVQEACEEAGRRYVQDLNEAWGPSDLATRAVEAYQRLASLLEELAAHGGMQGAVQKAYAAVIGSTSQTEPADAGGAANEPYLAYKDAIQKAWNLAEMHKRATEAHAEYLILFRDLQRQREQRSYDAYSAYLNGVNAAIEAANLPMRTDTALESSLSALQDEWRRAYEEQAEASLQALRSLQTPPESGKKASPSS